MKSVYNNVSLTPGAHEGGLCKIEIIPIEWLSEKIKTDFATGGAFPPLLIAGKDWLVLEFTPDSYSYDEKPKSDKGGSYYHTEIGGLTNDIDVDLLQLLETLRYHQFVVRATDLKKRQRLCGNIDAGMVLQINDDNKNSSSGKLSVGFNFQMEHEISDPAVVDPCAGLVNFTDCFTLPDRPIPPQTELGFLFDGGNLLGRTEFEVINLPGITTTFYLDAGDHIYESQPEIFWSAIITTATFKVRWRKICKNNQHTDWDEATFDNPFY